MTSEAVIVDITDNVGVGKTVRKGRNSFYSLPKTLSEDDDPFGVFQKPREGKQQAVLEGELLMKSVKETKEPSTGLLVQIETESPRISISESFNSVSSRYYWILCNQQVLTSAFALSGPQVWACWACQAGGIFCHEIE